MWNSFYSLLRKHLRARRFGVSYSRDRNWRVPARLRIGDIWIDLSIPEDHGTSIALKDIIINDVYWLGWISSHLRVSSVLDVGAHAGMFSLAARAYFADATIQAYEPNPRLWPMLSSHADQASFSAYAEGVGPVTGKGTFSVGVDSVLGCAQPSTSGDITITGVAEAIQRATAGQPLDLLKMDCEGAEWDILTDFDSLARVRCITMEYHLGPGRNLDDLKALLMQHGFQIRRQAADGPEFGRLLATRVT